MSVTINAKGTSTPFFRIGKQGITLYQGSTDPNTLYNTVNGDIWLDTGSNSLSVKSANNWVAPTLGTTNSLTFPTTAGSSGQVLSTDGEGNLSWISSSGTGTVTSTSVVSANGFAGSVANATSAPAITITTSVTGLIKGNGTAISAATSGTDYSTGTSLLSTGILKTTTGTGNLTIAEAGDFPTLNQNTTGVANNVTGIVSIVNGGTAANTANAAFNNLVPSQVTNNGKYLRTDGTNTSWEAAISSTGNILPLTYGNISSLQLITSSTSANQVVDSFSVSTYRTVKYLVQLTSGSAYQSSEITIIHNGTTAFISESGIIMTSTSLASFTADISGANVRLLVTPTNSATTINIIRTIIIV